MQITTEELQGLAVFVKQHMLDRSTKYDHDVFDVVKGKTKPLWKWLALLRCITPKQFKHGKR